MSLVADSDTFPLSLIGGPSGKWVWVMLDFTGVNPETGQTSIMSCADARVHLNICQHS